MADKITPLMAYEDMVARFHKLEVSEHTHSTTLTCRFRAAEPTTLTVVLNGRGVEEITADGFGADFEDMSKFISSMVKIINVQ